MAGTSPRFNAAGFRNAIKTAMQMGAPPNEGERATFHFAVQLVYNGSMDGDLVPFDPTATVTSTEPPTVQVDCAIEYFDAEGQPTAFGLLAPSRIAVTVLDVDYEQVKECSYVVVHGDRYDYRRTEPPNGLFDVGVYTMHFTSNSET
jgi:hypothetical protein